jgi:long-chain acyl-CoA synthetase
MYWTVYWLINTLVFNKVRQSFGGKLKYFVGGGALLDLELQKFFYAIGLPMYQGYGLSEASPVISSNNIRDHKMGSSGKIVPGLEVKICDEEGRPVGQGDKGEIVIKGDNVMLGYYRNEEATRETLRDGWLYTGDLGYFDREGFLYVLGRSKSLLIGDDGEKYSPEGIEEYIEEKSVLIRQILVYNNQDPYTTALIHPDAKALKLQLRLKQGQPVTEQICRNAIQCLRTEIDGFRKGDHDGAIPQRWLPVAFAIIDEGFTEENHFLNSTMKVVRGKITEHYRERIEQLYTQEGKDVMSPANIQAMKALLTKG